MTHTGKSINSFTWQHALVLLMGLLVFVLLLFAGKTNLNDDEESDLGGRAGDGGKSEIIAQKGPLDTDLLAQLPKDDSPAEIAQLRTALESEENAEQRVTLYKQIVEAYRSNGRVDLAAVYAAGLAAEMPDVKNFVVAGALFRNASHLPTLQGDSSIFRRLSDEAIRHTSTAVELDSTNEDANLELGLAMVESGVPANSMNGIFKIRAVAQKNPKNVEALFHLGLFSLDTKQDDKAKGRFLQILDVEPENVRAKYYLGQTELNLGNSAEFNRLMSEVANQTQDLNLAQMAKTALSNH
jgi:tetratricopeptide (TPR) repeat protein